MDGWRILVVDDDPINLRIIAEYLDDPRYVLDMAPDAETAWKKLRQEDRIYQLAIVDRMMPGMDGIELLRMIKANRRFRHMPVIMQTALASPQQVTEGIEAGAYYYLTKPYQPAALECIVRGVFADSKTRAEVAQHVARQVDTLKLVSRAEFEFATIDEANKVVGMLAAMCPDPETAAIGLTELLVNAVEHGNLGIDYSEKTRLRRENTWEAEIARRQVLPTLCVRKVCVAVTRRRDEIEFRIADEGEGFDWREYMQIDPKRAFDPNGRGIAMARLISFSRLEYEGRGNVVVATVDTPNVDDGFRQPRERSSS